MLNCSFKVGNTPSLNEAAFPGVNMLESLLILLFRIRLNSYLMISDIKQAFLRISLLRDFDKNKFSIIWRDANGDMVFYRFRTIVFGFISSPFILHYVIRFHISQFTPDIVSEILSQNFYVDNLFITGNDIEELIQIYKISYERMISGNFEF